MYLLTPRDYGSQGSQPQAKKIWCQDIFVSKNKKKSKGPSAIDTVIKKITHDHRCNYRIHTKYRVIVVLCNKLLLTMFGLFHCLPDLTWAGGNLA